MRAADAVAVEALGMLILVQKTSLLKVLGEQFQEGKGQETGISVNRQDGVTIVVASGNTPAPAQPADDGDLLDDLPAAGAGPTRAVPTDFDLDDLLS